WYIYKYKSKLKGGENCLKDYPNNIKGCFGLIILDEAHNLRNKTSGISQTVCDFIRYSRLLLKRRSIPEVIGPAAVKKTLTISSGTYYTNLILSKVFLEKHIIYADLDKKI
ncbi:hypothetical protein BO71DRAFT_396378, partial [Aspergillus ellipticus CBS 707.79]